MSDESEDLGDALLAGKMPVKRIKLRSCIPNTWNPNRMDQITQDKLSNLITKVGFLLPIVVRRHPTKEKRYQIIDGFHRWSLLKERGETRIDAVVVDVDKSTAMVLTNSLNYLKGEPDPEDYAQFYQEILSGEGITIEELEQYVPESRNEIEHILDNYNLTIDDIDLPDDVDDPTAPPEVIGDEFMELKFFVPVKAAEVIDAEITRIAATLKGKNVRGRALEFVAVLSAQTPIECIEEYSPFKEETEDHRPRVQRQAADTHVANLKPRKKKNRRSEA